MGFHQIMVHIKIYLFFTNKLVSLLKSVTLLKHYSVLIISFNFLDIPPGFQDFSECSPNKSKHCIICGCLHLRLQKSEKVPQNPGGTVLYMKARVF